MIDNNTEFSSNSCKLAAMSAMQCASEEERISQPFGKNPRAISGGSFRDALIPVRKSANLQA